MKENPWNVWLRNQVPAAFMSIFKVFARDPEHILQYAWLRFLPEHKDVTDPFFKPLVAALYSKLASQKCLVSESNAWEASAHEPPAAHV